MKLDYQFVRWERIPMDVPLQRGDIWASEDPNQPNSGQMKNIRPDSIGVCPGENDPRVNIGNGYYWRPVALIRAFRNLSNKEILASPSALRELIRESMNDALLKSSENGDGDGQSLSGLLTSLVIDLTTTDSDPELILVADKMVPPDCADEPPSSIDLPPPPEVVESPDKVEKFRQKLEEAINCLSMEGGSDTPDFILAEFLGNCLEAFDRAVSRRKEWYGDSPDKVLRIVT